MKLHTVTVFAIDTNVIDMILDFLYRKKILKKIFRRNDKLDNPCCIIKITLTIKEANKILASKFYNAYQLR